MGKDLTPVQRHWRHVEAIRNILEGMAEGEPKNRFRKHYEFVFADHQKFAKEQEKRK